MTFLELFQPLKAAVQAVLDITIEEQDYDAILIIDKRIIKRYNMFFNTYNNYIFIGKFKYNNFF